MNAQKQYLYEAERITLYLLGKRPGDREKRIYADAMKKLDIRLSNGEELLWQSMLRSKMKMACIDGGLALLNLRSPLRRKLFTMLAILEASPAYTEYFLPKRFSSLYLFRIMLAGMRVICRAIAGIIFLKLSKYTCS